MGSMMLKSVTNTKQFELVASGDTAAQSQTNDLWGAGLLYLNAIRFTYMRWAIALSLAAGGLAFRLFPDAFTKLSVDPPQMWPILLGLAVAGVNIPLSFASRKLNENSPHRTVEMNLWVQVALDLAAVTVLVHYAGSTTTFAPFVYLFHIILACIFFSRVTSLVITCLAAVVYVSLVLAELHGVLPSSSIMLGEVDHIREPVVAMVRSASAIGIWLVIWSLVSLLSSTVQKQDQDLRQANLDLVNADKEQHKRVVQTVNDLKSSFGGIKTSVELLNLQQKDSMDPIASAHFTQIYATVLALENKIRDILMLSKVHLQDGNEVDASCDLKKVMNRVVGAAHEKAWTRNVKVTCDVPEAIVKGLEPHYVMMFTNLLDNAVLYSQSGDTVEVTSIARDGHQEISVKDQGIGIAEKDLPHIFDEYYRSEEATALHEAAGLGLNIVKEIASAMDLKISVESEFGKGSVFTVIVPRTGDGENLRPEAGNDD